MRIVIQRNPRGIALIIVMLVIVVLSASAALFAYSMKVETTLARNVQAETEMDVAALEGLENARYFLGQQLNTPGEANFDALNQPWATGLGGTNELLTGMSLRNNKHGRGEWSARIIDLERRVNMNYANRDVLERALDLLQVDLIDKSTIVDSIEDWRDRNQNPQVNGAESDYYLRLPQPYFAKDGPIDDLSELLLVRGVTPDLYWGPGGTNRSFEVGQAAVVNDPRALSGTWGTVGLVDLFNTVGRMQININTASKEVLQLIPGIDEGFAKEIIEKRAGLDNVDGTEDDTPFHSPGELAEVFGAGTIVSQLARFCGVRSVTFEVQVDVQVDQYKRRLVALLVRTGSRNVQLLNMYWE